MMTFLPNILRMAAVTASLTLGAVLAAGTADAHGRAGGPGASDDACAMDLGEGGPDAGFMKMEMGGGHQMQRLHERLRGLRHRMRGMPGGGGDRPGLMGLGKLTEGIVIDQSVKKMGRGTKEVVTLRRAADGGTVTVKRRIKKTKGGADITGTVTTDDGKTASFKESFSQDKAGTITTTREFTDFQGRSHSVKRTATKDGDNVRMKTEITRPDGETLVFERAGNRDDGEFNFHKMSRGGKDRSIEKTVERDDDGKVRKTTIVIATGDQDRQVTITRERSDDSATLTIRHPDGTVQTFTRPCQPGGNKGDKQE